MGRKTFKNEEIHGFFKEIGLENEAERQRILLQGIINPREENKELTCILLDHSTVEENREDNNAKLEPNLR